MFRKRKSSRALCLGIALSMALVSGPASGADLTRQGAIGTEDAVQLFNLTVATAGSVDIRSYGYAGGTTSTGMVAPQSIAFEAPGQFLLAAFSRKGLNL